MSADGLYGSQSKDAAGGLSAEEAYKKYVGSLPANKKYTESASEDIAQNTASMRPTTYSKAVEYLRMMGVNSSVASGIRDQASWQRKKNSGSKDAEVVNYDNYQEYLDDIVEYMLQVKEK